MIIAILAALGLILGSFVNAMVWRFHEQAELHQKGRTKSSGKHPVTLAQLSMVRGRSMCSNCHHELAPKDLVPLFSWLWLRGKCRYCHQKIQDSPVIEVLLPVLFVVSYLAWPVAITGEGLYSFVFWLLFVTAFMALAAYDLRWYVLPDRIVFPLQALAALEFVGRFVFYDAGWPQLINTAAAIAVASGIFYVLNLASHGKWIGGGDVKLGVVLGFLAGTPTLAMLILFAASVLGIIVALPQLFTKKAGLLTRIPFGPYLIAGTFFAVLWGQRLIDWYMSLLSY